MKCKIYFFLVFSVIIIHNPSFAQQTAGKVQFDGDNRIALLTSHYLKMMENNNQLDGFRVQIFFDSGNLSKRNATEARERFLKQHPDIEAYIDFREPFFRVRVGNFRTRLEADGFRRRILSNYPNAFTVNDKITTPVNK